MLLVIAPTPTKIFHFFARFSATPLLLSIIFVSDDNKQEDTTMAAATTTNVLVSAAWLLSASPVATLAFSGVSIQSQVTRRSSVLHVGGSYLDSLSSPSSFTTPPPNGGARTTGAPGNAVFTGMGARDEFVVGVLGDLHIDPRKMDDYDIGRQHWDKIFGEARAAGISTALVSLGDLGESKNCDHNPNNPSELFAGTTACHMLAAQYLNSVHPGGYQVVGGNHDLEGIDEFLTDKENLDLFLRAHNKPHPQFLQYVTDKTLIVGLTSTLFRDAKYTSHEVTIDQEQIDWFEDVVKTHPASEGWRIFVFTHAPPNGSGLRVLQENHVVNGCCWLNHSNEEQCQKFINLVREHRCIKAWFSGHFHLGQDYQDSITFPTVDPREGPYPNRGSCVFAQTSVMRSGTSRDGRQQSRIIRGSDQGFEICAMDHAIGGALRVDATISYTDCNHEVGVYAHEDITKRGDQFFKVYAPCAGDQYHPPDENLVQYNEDGELRIDAPATKDSVAWWYMACGRVLGLLKGMMIEYDRSTLAPLGLVVGPDELIGKRIAVIDSGIEGCPIDEDTIGMEGADCVDTDGREQSLMLIGEDGSIVVIQPNEDGSYWRKIVRNKMIREREKRREKAAKEYAKLTQSQLQPQFSYAAASTNADNVNVVSSWGPYQSYVGTAKKTGVVGLTIPSKV